MSPTARRASWITLIFGLLVGVYVAAGFLLAPRFVRNAVLTQAAAAGIDLQVEEVRTNPFLLTVALRGVRLTDPQRSIMAAFPSALADLAWASLWRRSWIVQDVTLEQPSAEIDLRTNAAQHAPARQKPNITLQRLRISEGVVRILGPAPLELSGVNLEFNGSAYTLAARHGEGTLVSQGTVSAEPLAAQGKLELTAVPIANVWQFAMPGSDAAQGEVHAAAAYTYENGGLVLRDVAIDARNVAYAQFELEQVKLGTPQLELPSQRPFELTATAALKRGGRLSAQGTAVLQPASADLRLELANIPLALAKPFLAPRAALEIASGALSARGTLRIRPNAPRASYAGAASLRDVQLRAAGTDHVVLAWRSLQAEEAKVALAPFAAEVGEVLAEAPKGELVIDAEGRVNVLELLKSDESPAKERPKVSVRRLRIQHGTLHFADNSLETPFATTLRELSGAVSGLSTVEAEPARVQLEGRVGQYGIGRVRGTIDLRSPSTLTNLALDLRNLDLATFTPYTAKFAGYRIESGRLSAHLRYRVREARLVGDNKLVFERLQLGEKVEEKGALDIPLDLAVALLADSNGRIDLEVPVRGNLKDPQFDFAGLIARAFRNVIGKIASAPFRILGALVGGTGERLDALTFEPGSVALAPPEEEALERLAKALAERPQLELLIRGGYDPQADTQALARQVVRRELARRAGYDPKRAEVLGALDLRDPKIVRAAERLFLERGGGPLELIKFRTDERPYARVLFERLVAMTPVEPGSAERLAQARSETVRATLLARGVDPARVRLAQPAAAQAETEGVATTLALNAVRD